MNKRSRTKFSKFVSQQWWNNAKDWDWRSFRFQGWVWLEHFSCVWVAVRQVQMSWRNWGEWKTIRTWSIWDRHIISHSCILHSNSVFVSISCSGNVGFFFLQKKSSFMYLIYLHNPLHLSYNQRGSHHYLRVPYHQFVPVFEKNLVCNVNKGLKKLAFYSETAHTLGKGSMSVSACLESSAWSFWFRNLYGRLVTMVAHQKHVIHAASDIQGAARASPQGNWPLIWFVCCHFWLWDQAPPHCPQGWKGGCLRGYQNWISLNG